MKVSVERTAKFKSGLWDGYTSLAKKVRGEDITSAPLGLLPQFMEACELHGFEVEIVNRRQKPKPILEPAVEFWKLADKELRSYQLAMLEHTTYDNDVYRLKPHKAEFLESGLGYRTNYRVNGCGVWQSATGSGKTVACAALIQKLGVKTLFVVSWNDLVIQTAERFRHTLGPWLRDQGKDPEEVISISAKGKLEFSEITVAGTATFAHCLSYPKKIMGEVKAAWTVILRLLDTKLLDMENDSFDEDREAMEKLTKLVGLYCTAFGRGTWSKVEKLHAPLLEWVEAVSGEPFCFAGDGFLAHTNDPELTPWDEWYRQLLESLDVLTGALERYTRAWERREILMAELQTIDLVIADETHMAAGDGFFNLLLSCPAYYRIGMSGTPLERTDGQNLKIIAGLGEVLSLVSNKDMRDAGVIPEVRIEVVSMFGAPQICLPPGWIWHDLYTLGLVESEVRNAVILIRVREKYKAGLQSMILFRTKDHGDVISALFEKAEIVHRKLDGKSKPKERLAGLEEFRKKELLVLVASDIFGTGIDIPDGFNLLVNAAGGKGKEKGRGGIKVLQRLGRGLRGKGHVVDVLDFGDEHHYRLEQHAKGRESLYEGQGCFEVVKTHWADVIEGDKDD